MFVEILIIDARSSFFTTEAQSLSSKISLNPIDIDVSLIAISPRQVCSLISIGLIMIIRMWLLKVVYYMIRHAEATRPKTSAHETDLSTHQNAVQDTEPNLWFARQSL